MIPLLLAVLAAILAIPLLIALCVFVLIGPYDLKEAPVLIMAFASVSLAHILLLGLPAFFVLRWRGWLKIRTIAAAGLTA